MPGPLIALIDVGARSLVAIVLVMVRFPVNAEL